MNLASLSAGENGAPRMVVLGAPRCGTTSISKYLQDAGLSVGVKDSFFLMDKDAGLRGRTHLESHGTRGYLELFEAGSSANVEVSAGYLYQETALEFFSEWQTPPRFVVLARDPVDRIQSVYRYFMGNLGVIPDDCTFDQYVSSLELGEVASSDWTVCDALDQGNYVKWLSRWTDAFGDDAVSVVSFDNLAAQPAAVVSELIAESGGVSDGSLSLYNFEPRNASYVPRSKNVKLVTSVARKLAPNGALRSWAGERLRRWQAGSTPGTGEALVPDNDTLQRLYRYYEEPNEQLNDRFGVDTQGWIR